MFIVIEGSLKSQLGALKPTPMSVQAHTHTHTYTELQGQMAWGRQLLSLQGSPEREGQTHPQRRASTRRSEGGPHLVHVDVVKVVLVVDGLEHALQLPGGAAVDHQDEGDSDWVGQHILH